MINVLRAWDWTVTANSGMYNLEWAPEDLVNCWADPDGVCVEYGVYSQFERPVHTRQLKQQLAQVILDGCNQAVLAKIKARGEKIPRLQDMPAAMRDGLGLDRILSEYKNSGLVYVYESQSQFPGPVLCSQLQVTRHDGKLCTLPSMLGDGRPTAAGLQHGQFWWIGGTVAFPSHPTTIF